MRFVDGSQQTRRTGIFKVETYSADRDQATHLAYAADMRGVSYLIVQFARHALQDKRDIRVVETLVHEGRPADACLHMDNLVGTYLKWDEVKAVTYTPSSLESMEESL